MSNYLIILTHFYLVWKVISFGHICLNLCPNSVLLGGCKVMKAITLCRTPLQFHVSSGDERGRGGQAKHIFQEQISFGTNANQLPTEIHLEFGCHSARCVQKQWLHKFPNKMCTNGFAQKGPQDTIRCEDLTEYLFGSCPPVPLPPHIINGAFCTTGSA